MLDLARYLLNDSSVFVMSFHSSHFGVSISQRSLVGLSMRLFARCLPGDRNTFDASFLLLSRSLWSLSLELNTLLLRLARVLKMRSLAVFFGDFKAGDKRLSDSLSDSLSLVIALSE